jgi:hypothetical protein
MLVLVLLDVPVCLSCAGVDNVVSDIGVEIDEDDDLYAEIEWMVREKGPDCSAKKLECVSSQGV